MDGIRVFEIEKTATLLYHAAEKALVILWESLRTPQFREIVERGFRECGRLGVHSWIVDLTRDPGVPTQLDLQWTEENAPVLARRAGVCAILNVHGTVPVAKLGGKRWAKSAVSAGLETYECFSRNDALVLAAKLAQAKQTRAGNTSSTG